MAGSNLVYGMGMMEMGMTMSYEMLLCDAEFSRMSRRLEYGIPVNKETLALDVIKEIGPASNSLAHKHTRKFMRKELSTTQFINRTQRETWERKGAKTMDQAAHEKALEILENYHPEPLPEDVRKRIHDIVVEGEEEANELEKFKKSKA